MLPFERLRALETRGGFLRWVQFRNVDVLSRKKKSTVGILRGDSDLQLASTCIDVWWSSMVWARSCLYQQSVEDVSSSWDKEVDGRDQGPAQHRETSRVSINRYCMCPVKRIALLAFAVNVKWVTPHIFYPCQKKPVSDHLRLSWPSMRFCCSHLR